jgi:predicted porin
MKANYALASVAILLISFSFEAAAQGCVAVRNITNGTNGFSNEPKTWQFSANYRYFHSYKHFVGTDEQEQREENHNNVINNDHSIILGANYTLNNKWSFGISVPFIYINRTSLYEHYGNTAGNPRFSTSSNGVGDIRLVTNYMLIDHAKLKLQVGLGVKLPTGNYRYKDQFHKRGSQGQDSLVQRVVDQSIQPGDGGLGISLAFDGAYLFSKKFSVYATGMYMANPRNTNGVVRSNTLTNDANGNPIPLSNEFSVADQYFVRAGARYQSASGLQFSLGGRIECIPSYDLIGREDGFRRPGYIASVDPAVFYVKGNHIFGVNVPVALIRNRTRSYIDVQRGIDTNPNSERFGKPIQGDAAFADFLVSFSYAFRLTKKSATPFGAGGEIVK